MLHNVIVMEGAADVKGLDSRRSLLSSALVGGGNDGRGLLDDRRLHHVAELIAQEEAVDVRDLRHVDHDEALARIDAEEGSRRPGPTVLAHRAGRGEPAYRRAHFESQPEALAGRASGNVTELVRGHVLDALAPEDARAVQ